MKKTIKSSLCLLAVTAMLASCTKQGPSDTGIDDYGDFGDNSMALKDATDVTIGTAIDYTPFLNDASYSGIAKRDFDQVVFGYHMKHGAIVQDNGAMNFTNTDALVTAVGTQELFGHTLNWHANNNATYLKNFAGITVPAAVELLQNPGFEAAATLTNWNTFNAQNGSTVNPTTVAGEVRTGTRAMKVDAKVGDPTGQWKVQVASDFFNTVSGTQYAVSYYAKAASGTGSIRLSTAVNGGGSAQYQGDQAIPSSGFTLISWTFTANSPQTRLVFDMGAQVNVYMIDDVSVKEVITPPGGAAVASKLDQAMNTFITTMVNRYKSKVKAWDVVNEPFSDNPVAIRNNSNTSTTASDILVWSNYMGRGWAKKAFDYARAADPTADLYINDYNLETNPAKLDSLIAFVNELKTAGAKVDGIGTQMHIGRTNISYDGIDKMFQKLAATGLKIRVSELDVKVLQGSAAGKVLTPELAAFQAAIYKYVVKSYLKYIPKSQQAGITVWGINDKNSWLYNSGSERPLLYDDTYNKKPAYGAFLQGLREQ